MYAECHDVAVRPLVAVSSYTSGNGRSVGLGNYGYSYEFVRRAFEPLLQRWGEVVEVRRPESQLDYVVRQARRRGKATLALSFWPLQDVYLNHAAPNVLFPFWEFPDLPAREYQDNPRRNWARIANHASLVLTASHYTAAALKRAGVHVPICVVPVPVAPTYFYLPDWGTGRSTVLDCKAYVFSQRDPPPIGIADPDAFKGPDNASFRVRATLKAWARRIWIDVIKPCLPARLRKALVAAKDAGKRAWREGETELPAAASQLELSGVVYTTILNPDDRRKNWQDLLTAYLAALGDRVDATLIVKLATSQPAAVREVLGFYYRIGLTHRCQVAFITGHLEDEVMRQLVGASTYYANASRAEGACLPMQDFLAAGRPALAPVHTALTDYFDEKVGFVVASHPEPCPWPWDDSGRLSTSWHRIVWASLCDQFVASYKVARHETATYRELAAAARNRMSEWASAESVGPKLAAALRLAEPSAWQAEARGARSDNRPSADQGRGIAA
jgi:glycosyltransferase involved in cell wall biosynthesis